MTRISPAELIRMACAQLWECGPILAQRPSGDLLVAGTSLLPNRRRILAIASYEVVGSGGAWRVKHDGEPIGNYPSKEAAFEAAVAAALPVVREGYEVQISVPGRRIEP